MPDDTTLLTPGMQAVNDTVKYFSKTSAVFILRKDTINMGFFMKTNEDGTAAGYQPVINYLHYQQIPAGFTGNVLYFTFGRQFINGWQWVNGAISKTLSLGAITAQPPAQGNNAKLKTNEAAPVCIDVTYNYYIITRGNGVITHEDYVYSVTVTACVPGSDAGTGSPGGGTPSSGGGGGVAGGVTTPPTVPCNPASNPSSLIIVKGHVINQAAPPPGGGGGGSIGGGDGSTTNPCSTIVIQPFTVKTDTLNKNFPCAVKLIINKLLALPGYANLVKPFETNSIPDLNWTNQDLPWDAQNSNGKLTYILGHTTAITYSATIALNTQMLKNSSQLLIAATAIHETLHGVINYNIVMAVMM